MTNQGGSAALAEAGSQKNKRLKYLFAVIKISISLVILAAVYFKFRSQLPALSPADFGAVALASLLLSLQPPLIGLRWQKILQAYQLRRSLSLLIRITWVSVFANQFLPAGVGGDAIRVLFLRLNGTTVGLAVASVIADRIAALVALTILLIVFITFLVGVIGGKFALFLGVSLFMGLIVSYAVALLIRRTLSEKLENRLAGAKFMSALRYMLAIIDHPAENLIVLANAIGVHLLSAGAFLVVTSALGIAAPMLTIIAVSLLLTFVQMIPISIGGWGLREAVSVGLFSAYGVDGGHAALASIMLGVSYLLASLPGAILWLTNFKGEMIDE